MFNIKLSEPSYELFDKYDAREVLKNSYEEEELMLAPAPKNNFGQVINTVGEVWCLCKAIFNDGTEHSASAMCRGDASEDPQLLTVWNGSEDVSLILPPAPDFVLAKEGPDPFCAKFEKSLAEVFPINFIVVPQFQLQPHLRMSLLKQ